MQDLPSDDEGPRFVICATNLSTGSLWRFSKPYMADWRLGRIPRPDFSLARAVAASSAFPPVLSPLRLDLSRFALEPDDLRPREDELHGPPLPDKLRRRAVLTDHFACRGGDGGARCAQCHRGRGGIAATAADIAQLRRAFVPQLGSLPDYSLRNAYALYAQLLAPFAEDLKGVDHLVVAPGPGLSSLPFSLLVTSAPSERLSILVLPVRT